MVCGTSYVIKREIVVGSLQGVLIVLCIIFFDNLCCVVHHIFHVYAKRHYDHNSEQKSNKT